MNEVQASPLLLEFSVELYHHAYIPISKSIISYGMDSSASIVTRVIVLGNQKIRKKLKQE